jgi:hypothetical protein
MFTQMKKEEFITNVKLLKKEYLEILRENIEYSCVTENKDN